MVETSAATFRDEMKAADIDSIGQISCIGPGVLTRGYGSNIEAMVDYVKASPPADPDNPVLIAGDPERISLKERERDGIPIDETTWEQILDAGVKLGLNRDDLLKTSGI